MIIADSGRPEPTRPNLLPAPIAITPGEPSGIGPDLLVTLAAASWTVPLVAVASADLLRDRAVRLGIPLTVVPPGPAHAALHSPGTLPCVDIPIPVMPAPGHPERSNARYVLKALDVATRGCLSGRFSALVTGPVQKSVINQAGISFTGHTEYLAELSGGSPVMMLARERLRVALLTTHLPLREVPDMVTAGRLTRVLRILEHDLRIRFCIPEPRILVCGLNPHAGEAGHLGSEEAEIMAPALERLRAEGLAVSGPIPADTAFTEARLRDCDAVLAMYHDQGLPVLKFAGFGEAVNVTLGLPIIRTSVDHGTALALAGTGRAQTGSLRAALNMAIRLIRPHVNTGPVPAEPGR